MLEWGSFHVTPRSHAPAWERTYSLPISIKPEPALLLVKEELPISSSITSGVPTQEHGNESKAQEAVIVVEF